MKKTTIAIDIDGTIRNISDQIEFLLEVDFPEKIDEFRKIKGSIYRSLDPLFETKEDLYRWMYEERVFQIFGMAKRTHPKIIDDINIFAKTCKENNIDVAIASVQRDQSVTSTLHWLAKWGCKVQRIEFFDSMKDKINRNFDVYIDDCPDVIEAFVGKDVVNPKRKDIFRIPRIIKVPYNFTAEYDCPALDIANGKFDDIYDIIGIEKILKR